MNFQNAVLLRQELHTLTSGQVCDWFSADLADIMTHSQPSLLCPTRHFCSCEEPLFPSKGCTCQDHREAEIASLSSQLRCGFSLHFGTKALSERELPLRLRPKLSSCRLLTGQLLQHRLSTIVLMRMRLTSDFSADVAASVKRPEDIHTFRAQIARTETLLIAMDLRIGQIVLDALVVCEHECPLGELIAEMAQRLSELRILCHVTSIGSELLVVAIKPWFYGHEGKRLILRVAKELRLHEADRILRIQLAKLFGNEPSTRLGVHLASVPPVCLLHLDILIHLGHELAFVLLVEGMEGIAHSPLSEGVRTDQKDSIAFAVSLRCHLQVLLRPYHA
mmetsp:Transcript_52053/g.110668  ORF Transcript_52053/g.110668 Transcript_52053/m.110668 type:complete len:335 (-) Transcript_52053:1066-2070(-)